MAALDPEYPSLVITPPAATIDDRSEAYGAGRTRPAFVLADDEGWVVRYD